MMQGQCPKCGRTQSRGFMLDHRSHSTGKVSRWIEGAPERSWLGIRLRGRRTMEIEAYRCEGCGFVEFYASATPAEA